MSDLKTFSTGDRVRVSTEWFVEELRGAIGRIALPPDCITDQRAEGIYWIEFEEPLPFDDPLHPTDAASIDGESLDLLEP